MKKLLVILTVFTAANVWACDKNTAPVVVAPYTDKTQTVITDQGSYLVMPGSNTTYVLQIGKSKK